MEKKKRTRRLGWLASGLMCVAAAGSSFASDRDWKASTSLNYDTGKYGTSTRSSSLYVPVTIKRYWGDWYASLTLPYVSLTTDGRVTNVGGRPVRIRRGTGPAASTTQSGSGDLVVRGGYALLKEDAQPFDLTVVGKLKAPTADKDKGLGTGEFDEGAGLEFGKTVAPGWMILADLYYTVIGDPPGVNLNNQVAGDVGFSRVLQKDLTLTVLYEHSNALVSGEENPRDLRAMLDFTLDDRTSLLAGGMVGLSPGSADVGVTLGGSVRF